MRKWKNYPRARTVIVNQQAVLSTWYAVGIYRQDFERPFLTGWGARVFTVPDGETTASEFVKMEIARVSRVVADQANALIQEGDIQGAHNLLSTAQDKLALAYVERGVEGDRIVAWAGGDAEYYVPESNEVSGCKSKDYICFMASSTDTGDTGDLGASFNLEVGQLSCGCSKCEGHP